MERSRLIQRLEPPRSGQLSKVAETFSFGGGLQNGGLREEAMELLRPIFSFHYMGAAEYEFGAVPQTLSKIFEARKDYVSNMVAVNGDSIYVIAHKDEIDEAISRVAQWACEKWNKDLRDSTQLYQVLNPDDKWTPEVCGWLELDNGFFFFTNKEMFEGVCKLFEVTPNS
jgi:hypothetical protein